jgi:hypothetical protein
MLDTVILNITSHKINESKITNFKSEINLITGEETLTGNFKNFGVKQNGFGISIIGSMAKYYFDGSNLQTLSRQDTKRAIEMLSDELGLNIFESRVFRFDIGNNFIMEKNINNYLNLLGSLTFFTRTNYKDSLYYYNSNKKLIFYDKSKELKYSGIIVSGEFKDHNHRILRYECSFKKRLSLQFNIPELKAVNLYDENFFNSAINKWIEYYFKINKIRKLKFTNMVINNLKNLKSGLAAFGVNQIGYEKVINMIESSRENLSRCQISRLKGEIKKLHFYPALTEPNEAIKELDSKIMKAAEMYKG